MPLPLPVPDEISFHCPRALMGEGSKKKAVRQFSTVSGLAQHLESGACNGGKGTFRRVAEYAQEEMLEMSISAGPPCSLGDEVFRCLFCLIRVLCLKDYAGATRVISVIY